MSVIRINTHIGKQCGTVAAIFTGGPGDIRKDSVVFSIYGPFSLSPSPEPDHALAGIDYCDIASSQIIPSRQCLNKKISMAGNAHTTRVLYRMQAGKDFEWRVYANALDSLGARRLALKLKSLGIEALVCPSDEFEEKGLPTTYRAQEYF
ncbi:MAG: hypothetical protein L7T80_04130 [Arenicellales bacterium]|nr:hypothetical protein [Arenicellales bacterium]